MPEQDNALPGGPGSDPAAALPAGAGWFDVLSPTAVQTRCRFADRERG